MSDEETRQESSDEKTEHEQKMEDAKEEIQQLEEDPPEKLEDWPDGQAKYETFGGAEGDHSYDEGPEAKLGPDSVRHHEDGSVEVGGEKADDPDEFKGEPIPGGPTTRRPRATRTSSDWPRRRRRRRQRRRGPRGRHLGRHVRGHLGGRRRGPPWRRPPATQLSRRRARAPSASPPRGVSGATLLRPRPRARRSGRCRHAALLDVLHERRVRLLHVRLGLLLDQRLDQGAREISARAHAGTTIHRFLPSMPSAIAWPALESG